MIFRSWSWVLRKRLLATTRICRRWYARSDLRFCRNASERSLRSGRKCSDWLWWSRRKASLWRSSIGFRKWSSESETASFRKSESPSWKCCKAISSCDFSSRKSKRHLLYIARKRKSRSRKRNRRASWVRRRMLSSFLRVMSCTLLRN